MTVGELTNQLDKYDKNMRVVFSEYVYGSINGCHGYFPEPRDIAMVDDESHENCITLILESHDE